MRHFLLRSTNAFSLLSDPGYAKNLGASFRPDDRIPIYSSTPLEVLPQFAHQRSLVYPALCSFLQTWPKRGGSPPAPRFAPGLSRHASVELAQVRDLSAMLLIGVSEERATAVSKRKNIGVFCHLILGRKAVCNRAIAAFRADDLHHHRLLAITLHARARVPVRTHVWLSFLETKHAVRSGWLCSIHFFRQATSTCTEVHALVAAHFRWRWDGFPPINYQPGRSCPLCFFGDGGDQSGRLPRTLNLAALYRLPIALFVKQPFQWVLPFTITSAQAIVDRAEVTHSLRNRRWE